MVSCILAAWRSARAQTSTLSDCAIHLIVVAYALCLILASARERLSWQPSRTK